MSEKERSFDPFNREKPEPEDGENFDSGDIVPENKESSVDKLKNLLESKGYVVVKSREEIGDAPVNRDIETREPIDYLRYSKGAENKKEELKAAISFQEMPEEELEESLETLEEEGYQVYYKVVVGI